MIYLGDSADSATQLTFSTTLLQFPQPDLTPRLAHNPTVPAQNHTDHLVPKGTCDPSTTAPPSSVVTTPSSLSEHLITTTGLSTILSFLSGSNKIRDTMSPKNKKTNTPRLRLYLSAVLVLLTLTVLAVALNAARIPKQSPLSSNNLPSPDTSHTVTTLAPSISTSTPSIKMPANPEFDLPLHPATNGYVGTVTLTGYVVMNQFLCHSATSSSTDTLIECHAPYAYFKIIHSSTDLIYRLIHGNSTDSSRYRDPDEIGLGCYYQDQDRIYAGDEDPYGKKVNDIAGEVLSALLNATSKRPVTLELRTLPTITASGEDDRCSSDYELLRMID